MNNLQGIIDSLADQADDLLADASNRKEARTALTDALAAQHPKLNGIERQKITDAVMGILEEEEFFDTAAGGDEFDEEGDGEADE